MTENELEDKRPDWLIEAMEGDMTENEQLADFRERILACYDAFDNFDVIEDYTSPFILDRLQMVMSVLRMCEPDPYCKHEDYFYTGEL